MKKFSIFAGISVFILVLALASNTAFARRPSTTQRGLVTQTATVTTTLALPTTAPSPTLPPTTRPPVPTPHPCEGQVPAVPKLKAPADGAMVHSDDIALRWSKANCALRFRIRIRQDMPSRKIVHAWDDWIGNKLELTYLKPGKYRWRVTGCFRKVCGPRSAVRHFTVLP